MFESNDFGNQTDYHHHHVNSKSSKEHEIKRTSRESFNISKERIMAPS